jgi:hypothetical protein
MNENEVKACDNGGPNGLIRRLLNRISIKRAIRAIRERFRKSNMESWAEREIAIACKRERGESGEKGWDYGCACYESAYKAYKSLLKDGHSGFSIGLTQQILNRLIEGKPLTPIEDTPDVWNDIREYHEEEGYTDYQCKRMSALFKYVYSDGRIRYKDIDAWVGVDMENGSTYHSGLVQRLMDEMYPISMPYCPPDRPTKVYCLDVLTDRKNGDFDTVGIFYALRPDGERIEINRFFKEGEDDWIEITEEEYSKRQVLAKELIEREETAARYCEQDVKMTEELLRRKAQEDFDRSNSPEEIIKRAATGCEAQFLDD